MGAVRVDVGTATAPFARLLRTEPGHLPPAGAVNAREVAGKCL